MGLSVRNILFTGVLDRLVSRGDVKVIAFTPVADIAERYPHTSDHLIFEPLPTRQRHGFTGLLNHIINLRFKRINDDPALTSVRMKRQFLRTLSFKQYLFVTLLTQPFPRSKTIYRWLSAWHNSRMVISKIIPELFDRYQPDLVFATDPVVMREFDFLKYAQRTGIPTVGMIHSWDDLTTEGHIVVPLNHYLVWNQVMKAELIKLHGVSQEQISITGIPQFDLYAEPVSACGKEKFLIEQGLDPKKQTVLYATSVRGDTPEEPEILARLVSALNRECPEGIQLLVRVHPRAEVERYQAIKEPNVRFQIPGAQAVNVAGGRLMGDADLRLLRDTLVHSDVVVNTASTISIDAIALDKPVVNIVFDLHEKDYIQSVRRYMDMVHFKPVISSQGTKLARSFDDLVRLIRRYLDDPKLERAQRADLAQTMTYQVDGKSAERIALFLLEALDGKLIRNYESMAKR